MKTLFFAFVLSLSTLHLGIAQEFYLPVSTTSASAKAAYHKAEEYASNVNFSEANAALQKALTDDPDFFMAHALKVFYSSGETKAKAIDQALTIDAGGFNKAEQIIRQLLTNWDKDPEASTAEQMKALVAAYPNTPQAYHWACLHSIYTDNNPDAALKYAEKLAALSPDFAPNYNTMGYIYLEKEQMAKAKAAFENYIKLLPNEANAYDSMGEYYMVNKEYAKSAEFYDKAASMGMDSAKELADKARKMME